MPRHPVQPPEWIDSAPVLVEESIDVAVPPDAVWSHIADHERWPEWFTDLDAVEVLGRPTGVGGGRRVTIKRGALDEEFTAWDENEHFAFAVVSSPLPILDTMAESVQIAATDAGCRVTYRQGLLGRRGFGWLLSLVAKRMRGQLQAALQNLKARAETS